MAFLQPPIVQQESEQSTDHRIVDIGLKTQIFQRIPDGFFSPLSYS